MQIFHFTVSQWNGISVITHALLVLKQIYTIVQNQIQVIRSER